MRTFLFLALSTKGFGETILGVQLARRFRDDGDEAIFIAHDSSAKLLEDSPFEYMTITEQLGSLLPVYVEELIDRHKPAAIVLSDFFTTTLWFGYHGINISSLKKHALPILAIDTWCIEKTGLTIDLYWHRERNIEDWTNELDLLIQPAPLAVLDSNGIYSCLSVLSEPDAQAKKELRSRLNLSGNVRLVLFCTATWQQTTYACAEAQRFAAELPVLLGRYFSRLDANIHLVHIGKEPYHLQLGNRYHWLSQMTPEAFDMALAGCDLLLTANISSTTISKAMCMDIPVLAMINSIELESTMDLATLPFSVDDEDVAPWLTNNLPLYRYYMWPIGYYSFLKPILEDGDYLDAITTVELLNRNELLANIEALVYPSPARSNAVKRQQKYLERLSELPDVTNYIRQVLH